MADDRRTAPPPDAPSSWRAISPGADVHDRAGGRVGTLRSVEGDERADIFHGIVVETDGRAVLVPADAVGTIAEGRIDLTMAASEVRSLDDWSDAGASAAPLGEREAPGSPGPPAI